MPILFLPGGAAGNGQPATAALTADQVLYWLRRKPGIEVQQLIFASAAMFKKNAIYIFWG